ncbi:hypothetical protein HK104_001082, partial [Borealophlyctis nickersoniae]
LSAAPPALSSLAPASKATGHVASQKITATTTVIKKIITTTHTGPDGSKTVTQQEIVTTGEPVVIASAADTK